MPSHYSSIVFIERLIMKTLYLISVLNAAEDTSCDIAELLTPDAVVDPSSFDWDFCDIKEVVIGDSVDDFF